MAGAGLRAVRGHRGAIIGFEVGFVDPHVGERRASLGDVVEMAFERVAPVRSFPSYKGQRNYPGYYYAATMDAHVMFESWLASRHRVLPRSCARVATAVQPCTDICRFTATVPVMLSAAVTASEPPDRHDIVALVSQYTTLWSAGSGRLRGNCPFCGSTAFGVRPAPGTGVFFCFRCGEGGDSVVFTAKIEGKR
jgi:hypothetical protein